MTGNQPARFAPVPLIGPELDLLEKEPLSVITANIPTVPEAYYHRKTSTMAAPNPRHPAQPRAGARRAMSPPSSYGPTSAIGRRSSQNDSPFEKSSSSTPSAARKSPTPLYDLPFDAGSFSAFTSSSPSPPPPVPIPIRSQTAGSSNAAVPPITTDQEILNDIDANTPGGDQIEAQFPASTSASSTQRLISTDSAPSSPLHTSAARSYTSRHHTMFSSRSPRTSPRKITSALPAVPLHPGSRSNSMSSPGPTPADGRPQRRSPGHPPPVPLRKAGGTSPANREGSVFGKSSSYSRSDGGVGSPSPADLSIFAHHCEKLYFETGSNENSESARYISTTLASLPPSHRAAYTRIQNALRAQSHEHATRVRIAEFHALVISTQASASLSPMARRDMSGLRAKAERAERLQAFVSQWCSKSAVGVEPFFRGLYNGLQLQSKGRRDVGGAGPHRIVWEIDDAVFMESGGKDFMHEAITVLKGILGFEDTALSKPPRLRRPSVPLDVGAPRRRLTNNEELVPLVADIAPTSGSPDDLLSAAYEAHSRSTSESFNKNRTASGSFGKRGPAPPVPKHPPHHRHRASDPLSPSPSSAGVRQPLLDIAALEAIAERKPPLNSGGQLGGSPIEDTMEEDKEEEDLSAPRLRLWTFPAHLTDSEIGDLLRLFPNFLIASSSANLRIPLPRPSTGRKDIEEPTESSAWPLIMGTRVPPESTDRYVRPGTGRLWVGDSLRSPGWEMTFWDKVVRWFKRLFGA